jgi:hypothetical protein
MLIDEFWMVCEGMNDAEYQQQRMGAFYFDRNYANSVHMNGLRFACLSHFITHATTQMP